MFSVQLIFILSFCLNSVTSQACDTSSNTPQCSTGEVCSNNKCEPVTPSATIQGVLDKPVGIGTNLTLTCTAVKVNTRFTRMYWVVGGRNESGTITTGEGVLVNILFHEVTLEDELNPIACVVVSRFTDVIKVEKTLNLAYAPIGWPMIQASTKGQYKGEEVSLTCDKYRVAANPPCNAYDWWKQEGNINFTPETQIYTFIMDKLHAGTYTCRCRNIFGGSEVSYAVKIVYLGEKHKAGLIAVSVIGSLVVVMLVVVVVFACRQYNIKLHIQKKKKKQGRSTNKTGKKTNQAYEIPVNGVEPTNNTDTNNEYAEPIDRAKSEMSPYQVINEDKMDKEVKPTNNTDTNNECAEPIDRPKSEMGQYQVINEDNMDKDGQTGFVNTAFTTYEDVQPGKLDSHKPNVQAGKPDSHKPNVQAGKPDSHKPNVQAGKLDSHKPVIRIIRTTNNPTVVSDSD